MWKEDNRCVMTTTLRADHFSYRLLFVGGLQTCLELQSHRLLACLFRATGKAIKKNFLTLVKFIARSLRIVSVCFELIKNSYFMVSLACHQQQVETEAAASTRGSIGKALSDGHTCCCCRRSMIFALRS